MHITKRDGLRTVTFTEEEFDTLHTAYCLLMATTTLETEQPNTYINNGDSLVTRALELLALDDGIDVANSKGTP